MSDEFSRRLGEAAAKHGAQADALADVASLTASVIGKARRRRRITGALTVAGAFVGLAVVAAGSLAVVNQARTDRALTAAALEVPTWGPSSPPAETTISTLASVPPSASIGDLPPLAPARGDGFPAAHEMRDWVWDYVGPGWSLESYSASAGVYAGTDGAATDAVIYLVGPEGETFELQALAPEYAQGLRVVSWQEEARTAHIAWDGDHEAGVPSGGAEIDLTTGSILPIVFSTPWGVSSTVAPVAISAAGNELWEAWLGRHVRFYRYGAADGWTVATVNDLDGIGDRDASDGWGLASAVGDAGAATRPGGAAARPDGAAVLFERRASGRSSGAPEEVAVYDVDSAQYATSDVAADAAALAGDCLVSEWLSARSVQYACTPGGSTHTVGVPSAPDVAGATGLAAYPRRVTRGAATAVTESGSVGYLQAPPQ